jgi:hypothetical protein
LATDEIIEYLNSIKKAIDEVPNKEISNGNIELYLDQYDISYDELFQNEENGLVTILENNPLAIKAIKINHKPIQDSFYQFWYKFFLDKAQKSVNEISASYNSFNEKVTTDKLNGTEKVLLITLLQEADLFPKAGQLIGIGTINELISALTGISDVREISNNKIPPFFTSASTFSPKQLPDKAKNIKNVKPFIDSLNDVNLNIVFEKIEKKIKNTQ